MVRYHHLFADVLRARLLDEQPDNVRDLHGRASAWYEKSGEPSEAIRHALGADDFPRAADLLEPAAPALLRSRQEAMLLGWLKALPEEVLRCRPVLDNAYAGALLSTRQLDGVEAHLWDAERWLDGTTELMLGHASSRSSWRRSAQTWRVFRLRHILRPGLDSAPVITRAPVTSGQVGLAKATHGCA